MIINLPEYHETDNPDAFVDTDKSFEEQTEIAKEYIENKTDAEELPIKDFDKFNRATHKTFFFSNEGFKATFKQNYFNSASLKLNPNNPESITKIEIVK